VRACVRACVCVCEPSVLEPGPFLRQPVVLVPNLFARHLFVEI
jgi:hypothetical protein